MNAVISSVVRAQASNPASASKIESETAKSVEEVSGGQNTASETSVSSKYDTLDLSQDYLEYKTQSENTTLQDETNQLNSTVAKYTAESSSEETAYFNPLYSYTDIELQKMLRDGTISKEEYEVETSGKKDIAVETSSKKDIADKPSGKDSNFVEESA